MNRLTSDAAPGDPPRRHRGVERRVRRSSERGYWVYILRCADRSLYTGFTVDVERRLALHTSGRGAKYTRTRLPVTLVYSEKVPSLGRALRRENEIKRMKREEKLLLLSGPGGKIQGIR